MKCQNLKILRILTELEDTTLVIRCTSTFTVMVTHNVLSSQSKQTRMLWLVVKTKTSNICKQLCGDPFPATFLADTNRF